MLVMEYLCSKQKRRKKKKNKQTKKKKKKNSMPSYALKKKMKMQWSGTDTIEVHILPQTPNGKKNTNN